MSNKTSNNLLSLIRPDIQTMKAYQVQDAAGMVKLDAMENPFGWPDEMKVKWLELMANVDINRYPDSSASKLVKKLRATFAIADSAAIILGNGSDELIQLMLMSLNPGASVLVPDPSFVMYKQISTSLGLSCEGVPLNDDFSLNMPKMLAAIKANNPAMIFLAYPNNPTANLFDDADIMKIVEASNGLVVIDEAYQPFAGKTFMQKIGVNHPQLMVMRTVSKLGLAGIRLGYLVGDKVVLEQFEKIRLPYNINALTQITASFAFDHIDELDKQAETICQQREFLSNELAKLTAVTVYPSSANFILFSVLNTTAQHVFEALKKEAILIKLMGNSQGIPAECLRVTVGTRDQNNKFIQAIKNII